MGYFISNRPEAPSEPDLVRSLASSSVETVRAATHGLWEFWLNEVGPGARAAIDLGVDAMREGDLDAAALVFSRLIDQHPGWAEPINKLATVLYLQGEPSDSIDLCAEVVKLKPDHFGAWNGMALCAMQTGDWLLAREAALQSLRLQPHSAANQQILTLVDSRLANC